MKRGFLITFEGIEGSGKSTHVRRLVPFLKKRGYRVLHLREPGGTPAGEAIRRILLSTEYRGLTALAEVLLYEAARAEIVRKKILPALNAGQIVLCDRFQDATEAYQSAGGIGHALIERLGREACQGLRPNLTIFLDLPVEEGLRRSGRGDRIEQKPLSYHRRVQRAYLRIWKREPRRVKRIRAGDLVHDQTRIREIILHALRNDRRSRPS